MIFKHLLPRAHAWLITPVAKALRKFFNALESVAGFARDNFDEIYNDLRPQKTRRLDEWNDQYALPDTNMTEQAERDRLAARMKALGGQTLEYIQETLQAAGFPLYVHKWYTLPGPVARDPSDWLGNGERVYSVLCGELDALCGEPDALCGETEGVELPGYLLVNLLYNNGKKFTVLCGEPDALCGEPDALCGEFIAGSPSRIQYLIPSDPDVFPFFIYIGGETFGEVVNINPSRRLELETLVLKLRPLHCWVGMFVRYN